jgi:endonuclease/exonuclease/phosphatase family metal-dependent hydrolase
MRVATFNLENLDLPLGARAGVLRPAIERLRADILCLQEVNGQHVRGEKDRKLLALDELLKGTEYEDFHRVATSSAQGGAVDVHNLVTCSRFPIVAHRQVQHALVAPLEGRIATAEPAQVGAQPIRFDRPILFSEIAVGGRTLHLFNVHLRAPLATVIPGGKLAPFTWKAIGPWAEGYYLSSVKRAGQALELRLLVDQILDRDADALVLAAGDFNAEDHETPLRIVAAAAEDTGNANLTTRSMVILDRAIELSRRYSILHHGRPQMVDHMLATHALSGHFRSIEVHNEAVSDEALAFAKHVEAMGSYHAAVVADFAFA